MKSTYLLAALLAVGLAGCKTEVSTTPASSSSPTSTTKVEVTAKPAEPTTVIVPAQPTTTETTKQTTVVTPSGRTATKTETTTETKKP